MDYGHFTNGFIKSAAQYGIPERAALKLANAACSWDEFRNTFIKHAGTAGIELARNAGTVAPVFGEVGNFAHDMFVAPVKGIFSNAGDVGHNIGQGRFTDALWSLGKSIGNTGLTALNFIPGAGLGRQLITGAGKLFGRSLGMAGTQLPTMLSGSRLLSPMAKGFQAAAPRTAKFIGQQVPVAAGFAGQQYYSGLRDAQPVPAPVSEPTFEIDDGMSYL